MSRYNFTPPKSPARKRRARRKPSTAVLYLRVSSASQDTFEQQRDTAMAKATSLGMNVIALCEETSSASGTRSWQRPELQQALRLAKSGGHALIVARIDRLSRNLDDVPKLLDTGVPIYSADRVRRLSEKVLKSGVRKGQIESLRKAEIRRLEANMRRLKGKKAGRRIDPTVASAGRFNNQLRRDDNIRAAASVLALDPDWMNRTHRKRAEILQAAGILRQMQVDREVGKTTPWTRDAVKTSWRRLRDEIELILSPDE